MEDSGESASEGVEGMPPGESGDDVEAMMKLLNYSGPPSEIDVDFTEFHMDEMDDEHIRTVLNFRPEFHRFADWIFGPDGIASVQIVVYGDFAYSRHDHPSNVALRRYAGERMKFEIITPSTPEWNETLSGYYDALGACPTEPFIDLMANRLVISVL
jgi:hypothetical protein